MGLKKNQIMRTSKLAILLFTILLFTNSCKKEEVTDTALNTNFNIDVHGHLKGNIGFNQFDFIPAADSAIKYMDKWEIDKMLIMPPPFTNQSSQDGTRYEIDDMISVINKYPNRFHFLGGGNDLNVMIQQEVTGTQNITVTQFKTKATEIAAMQGFVGFGEITTLHFSLGVGHVFQQADPDHFLFLALVDIAAQENVPISIHQEAVPDTILFPTLVNGPSSENPDTLYPNITKFENLLNYAQTNDVKIIWDHAGWDNTGEFSTTLCRNLLLTHSNLYFSIKISPYDTYELNRVVDANENLKSEWLLLFNEFPDHFMIGADHFQTSTGSAGPPSMNETWSLINLLPDNLKKKLGYENAAFVFNLN